MVTGAYRLVNAIPHDGPTGQLKQDFYASDPNQKRCGDITYLRTDEGGLYLMVMTDLR